MTAELPMPEPDGCNLHPCAPHGFARQASHSSGEYVCECAGFTPSYGCNADQFRATIAALEAERDALRADALRWRYVRDNADITLDAPVWIVTDTGHRINVRSFSRHENERAIDAALNRPSGEEKA